MLMQDAASKESDTHNPRTHESSNKDSAHLRCHSPVSDIADHALNSLGYKPELARNRSTLQVAFMSFVLASVPYGLATMLYYPILGGGPVNIIWGWFMVSMITLCVATSLGEITSVYPTAGGITLCLDPLPSGPSPADSPFNI